MFHRVNYRRISLLTLTTYSSYQLFSLTTAGCMPYTESSASALFPHSSIKSLHAHSKSLFSTYFNSPTNHKNQVKVKLASTYASTYDANSPSEDRMIVDKTVKDIQCLGKLYTHYNLTHSLVIYSLYAQSLTCYTHTYYILAHCIFNV